MVNANEFKKKVKDWMQNNPSGGIQDLTDYCEEIIPPSQYAAHSWLIEQTVAWYKHLMMARNQHNSEFSHLAEEDSNEA